MKKGITIPGFGLPFNIYPLRDEWESKRLEKAMKEIEDAYHCFMRDVVIRRNKQ